MKYLIKKLFIYMTKDEVIRQFGIEFAKKPSFSVIYAVPEIKTTMENNITSDELADVKYTTYVKLPNGDFMLDLYYKELYGGNNVSI